jgi:hypothetical protein
MDVMIGIWSESESSSSHGWHCNTCSAIPDVAKVKCAHAIA